MTMGSSRPWAQQTMGRDHDHGQQQTMGNGMGPSMSAHGQQQTMGRDHDNGQQQTMGNGHGQCE